MISRKTVRMCFSHCACKSADRANCVCVVFIMIMLKNGCCCCRCRFFYLLPFCPVLDYIVSVSIANDTRFQWLEISADGSWISWYFIEAWYPMALRPCLRWIQCIKIVGRPAAFGTFATKCFVYCLTEMSQQMLFVRRTFTITIWVVSFVWNVQNDRILHNWHNVNSLTLFRCMFHITSPLTLTHLEAPKSILMQRRHMLLFKFVTCGYKSNTIVANCYHNLIVSPFFLVHFQFFPRTIEFQLLISWSNQSRVNTITVFVF